MLFQCLPSTCSYMERFLRNEIARFHPKTKIFCYDLEIYSKNIQCNLYCLKLSAFRARSPSVRLWLTIRNNSGVTSLDLDSRGFAWHIRGLSRYNIIIRGAVTLKQTHMRCERASEWRWTIDKRVQRALCSLFNLSRRHVALKKRKEEKKTKAKNIPTLHCQKIALRREAACSRDTPGSVLWLRLPILSFIIYFKELRYF